jgi:hypothetical protein
MQHTSVIDSFRTEFVEYLAEHGMSTFLHREAVLEQIVPPGMSSSGIEQLLRAFLGAVGITTELIIVDPYFFASTRDPNYAGLIVGILKPTLPGLRELKIVTMKNSVDTTVKGTVTAALNAIAPGLTLTHQVSGSFHDRFWINPVAAQGFICGTSLNGLGRRYALLDNLKPSDTADVIAALRTENLL